MHKYHIISIFAVLLNVSAAKAITRDSIGVENLKGKKVILHKVDAKDTYYAIGRRYNIVPKDIIAFNDNKILQIGTVVKVPTNTPFVAETTSKNTAVSTSKSNESTSEEGTLIEHAVQRKENLNMLANKYGTTVNEIKRVNNLGSINLKIGQVLKIPAKNIPADEKPAETTAQTKTQEKQEATNTSSEGVIEHTVQRKENLNMIANKYGITVNELKRANNLNSSNLQIGQHLKIPAKNAPADERSTETPVSAQQTTTETAAAKPEKKTEQVITPIFPKKQPVPTTQNTPVPANTTSTDTTNSEDFIEHTVASNETIYSIATRYKMTMDQLKAKNNLPDNSLRVGQKLLIKGQYPVKPVPVPRQQTSENHPDTLNSIKNPSLRLPASRYGLNQIEEKGTGTWIADPDLDPAKMLVLHRTAPIGTVMKITNPMSNRSTFAKVVGKFTENESTKDVIIVMTKAVADALGALDKRFFCNLTYGGQDNEQ